MTVVRSSVAVLDSAGQPAEARIVRAYRRSDGAFVGETKTADGIPTSEVLNNALNNDSPGWSGYSCRVVVDASLLKQFDSIRASLKAAAATGFEISSLFVGAHDETTDCGFHGAPVRLTFGGLNTFVATAGSTIVSDIGAYKHQAGKGLVFSFYFSGPSDIKTLASANPGWTGRYDVGRGDAGSTEQNPTGYTSSIATYLISSVEMYGDLLDTGNYSINCGESVEEVTVVCLDDGSGGFLSDLAARATPS